MGCAKIAAVLLAAGHGTRFGGNKLETLFKGEMLGLYAARTLAKLNCDYMLAVHNPANAPLGAALRHEGFVLIDNEDPSAGQGHSMALAAQAALETDAAAILVCLADMPLVTLDHLRSLTDAQSDHVVASAIGTVRMPPALFPRRLFPALACLSGDIGARALLTNAIVVAGNAEILADIDTPADLNHSS